MRKMLFASLVVLAISSLVMTGCQGSSGGKSQTMGSAGWGHGFKGLFEKNDDNTKQLVSQLRNGDTQTKVNAARALGECGRDTTLVVEALEKAQTDQCPEVRQAAKDALCRIGTPLALHHLEDKQGNKSITEMMFGGKADTSSCTCQTQGVATCPVHRAEAPACPPAEQAPACPPAQAAPSCPPAQAAPAPSCPPAQAAPSCPPAAQAAPTCPTCGSSNYSGSSSYGGTNSGSMGGSNSGSSGSSSGGSSY